jgi:hypothetical protein
MTDELPAAAEAPQPQDAAEEKPLGLFQQDADAFVKQVLVWLKEASDAASERRLERDKEWAALAGDQWEASDKLKVESGGRPALTLNMLLTIMAAVEGEERTNRQEMKLYGVGKEDDQGAHALNKLLKWVMEQTGGEFALSEQFRHGSAVGEGWVVPEVDYFVDPEGQVKLSFVDEDEMFDDPLGKCPVSSDSRFLIRLKMMPEDEIEARWPGSRDKLKQRCMANGTGPETDGKGYRDIYSAPSDSKSIKLYDAKSKMWGVLEVWWWQIEPGWVMIDEATGLLVEKNDGEMAKVKAEREMQRRAYVQELVSGALHQKAAVQAMMTPPDPMTGMRPAPQVPPMPAPIQATQRSVKRFYQAFTCYEELLERRQTPIRTPSGEELKRFPYVPFRALFDKKKGNWFGLLKPLIDPQRQHNVEQSVIVQLMQLMPKSSWMGPKGSFHNKQEWERGVAQPGKMLEYNAARGKPEQIKIPDIPRHLIDMAFSRPQSMREISGVNVELTGQRQGQDAGIVMEMRSKAAKTVLAPIFDNFRRTKKELGRVLIAYIQTYVTRGRRVRVLGPDEAEFVEMTEEMQLGRYDLAVEETNSSINDRMATLAVLQTTLPQLIKAGVPVPPELIDLLPMSPHIRDSFKRLIAWQMTVNNLLPPPDWQPGMPVPMPAAPPIPPGAAPAAPPA